METAGSERVRAQLEWLWVRTCHAALSPTNLEVPAVVALRNGTEFLLSDLCKSCIRASTGHE